MTDQNVDTLAEGRKEAYRTGVVVLILLGVLSLGEFFIGAVASVWWAPLILIALLKAYFVLRDYMHVSRLFAPEEEVH